jgi:hypothetical protein
MGMKQARSSQVLADLSPLLVDTPLAFYWAGFLAADASFNPGYRLVLTLSAKDEEHLARFRRLIRHRGEIQYDKDGQPLVACQDRYYGRQLMEKFGLVPNKTEHPPDLKWLSGDLFTAFLIGFIDGDGCINRQTGRLDSAIRIKLHVSWLDTLSVLSHKLHEAAGVHPIVEPHPTAEGYALLNVTNRPVLRWLQTQANSLGLPVLRRKWDRIDARKESRQECGRKNRDVVLALNLAGKTNAAIVATTGIGSGSVRQILSRAKRRAN